MNRGSRERERERRDDENVRAENVLRARWRPKEPKDDGAVQPACTKSAARENEACKDARSRFRGGSFAFRVYGVRTRTDILRTRQNGKRREHVSLTSNGILARVPRYRVLYFSAVRRNEIATGVFRD